VIVKLASGTPGKAQLAPGKVAKESVTVKKDSIFWLEAKELVTVKMDSIFWLEPAAHPQVG
jgi:hypothetical protein